MPENRIFAANRAGKMAHLLQFHHPSTELIELAAMAGLDGVDLDGEHGHFTLSEVDAICRLANAYGMTVTAGGHDAGSAYSSPSASRLYTGASGR